MQRTTSFEPILCNLCVEETRSYYREDCEKCGWVTCNDCLSEDVLIVFNKRWSLILELPCISKVY